MSMVSRNPSLANVDMSDRAASPHDLSLHDMAMRELSPQVLAQQGLDKTSPSHHSTYSIYKRIANLALAIFMCVICLNLWILSSDRAQRWHDQQANQLGRSLAGLSAGLLQQPLSAQDITQLQTHLEYLTKDSHIISATVHNAKGSVVASSPDLVPLVAQLGSETSQPLVFIEPIKLSGQRIGYLRLLLDEAEVMAYHDDYQRQLYEQMIVLLLIAGAVGLFCARAFYKFRFRHYRKVPLPEAGATAIGE